MLKLFLRYAHAFSMQSSYTALEFIALMLGVRRAGVTIALQGFESKGLIEKGRGSITVRDRDGLEASANGLYGPPKSEYERLFT